MAELRAIIKVIESSIIYRIIALFLLVTLGIFVTIAILVGFFPQTFGPFFSDLITLRERGIYADCSLATNKNNRICSGIAQEKSNNRDWSALQKSKKPLPFNLHNGK